MDLDLNTLKIDKENYHVEVKSAQYSLPNSIWETYSAFSNTDGGQIILGISENKKTKELVVTGIDEPEIVKKQFWDAINNPQKISNNTLSDSDFNEIKLEDGKVIFVIHVPKARLELRPIYINDDIIKGSFKRNHEGDYHLTKEEISSMLRDASPYSYDSKVIDELPVSVLSDKTIEFFRNYHSAHRPNHPWLKLSKEEYLVMIGALAYSDKDGLVHPTMAGLLMFSQEPVITRIFPEYFLDYRENLDPQKVRWTDRIQSVSGVWSGNVFDFFLLVNNKLVMDFKLPFKLEGMVRVDNTSLHDATREAFVNCLSNADYFGRCGVVIKKNIDSIVFENPGSIRVGKKQMLQGGLSDTRNKNIMKMFNLLGYGEKAESGIPFIIQAVKEYNLPMPQVDENRELDRTSFTIFLNQTTTNDVKYLSKANDDAECFKDNAENILVNAETDTDDAEKTYISAEELHETESGIEPYAKGRQIKKKQILDYLKTSGSSSSKDIAKIAGISLRRTQELLKEMVGEGIIKSEGIHPNYKYSFKG